MKKLLIVAVIFSAAFVSCKSSKNIKSFSEKDSLYYAIGIGWGADLQTIDSVFNVAAINAAFQDVIDKHPQMTREEAYAFINEYFGVRVPARNKAEGEAFLADVKKSNPNVRVTDSGLMYEIIDEGDMSVRATSDADQVMVNYRGTLKDGTEFDQNDSIKFPLNRVIPAWTEGMKLVGKGGEIILWVPSELGYGSRGSGAIPPNSALKFEVSLLDVIPAEQPAE